MTKKYGIKSATDNSSAVSYADVVVLSVKPQRLSEVMKGLKGIRVDALVLSIIAGANLKKISAGLKHKAIVRSMPNTPGQIGEGITVWAASKEVTAQSELSQPGKRERATFFVILATRNGAVRVPYKNLK